MILNYVDARHGKASVTPESPDDLWAIRRVVARGDLVAGETSRVFKETNEYARPDKERIRVSVTLQAESIKLDSTLSRLRISGKILEVSNDLINKGTFHSLNVSEGHKITIKKAEGSLSSLQLGILKSASTQSDSYGLVAMDRRNAGIGVMKGTHLQVLPSIESGMSGKMYAENRKSNQSNVTYFEKIFDAISTVCPSEAQVFVLGPGTTKNAFANYASERKKFLKVTAIEGLDVTGEDGVYTALRIPNLQEAIGESRLAKVSKILQEVMKRIAVGNSKVAFAFKECLSCAKAGAVEALLVSDRIFVPSETTPDEESIVELLNTVEGYNGETFLLDSSTDLGSQVSSLGGIVGLLRYSVPNAS